MDPMTWLMIAQLGTGLLGGLMGGEDSPQEMKSFEGTSLDPRDVMAESLSTVSKAGQALTDRTKKGVQLRGVNVQTPGGRSGGGLPMSIGLSGVDPSLADPSINTRPGLDLGQIFPDPNQWGDPTKRVNRGGPSGAGRPNINNAPVTGSAVRRIVGRHGPFSGPDAPEEYRGRSPQNPITTDPTGSREEALQHLRRLGFKV